MNDIYADIRSTERNLSFETEDVLDTIHAMGGRSGHIPSTAMIGDEANGESTMDAAEALDAKALRSNTALIAQIERWKTRRALYDEKSKSMKSKPQERLTFLDKFVELDTVLTEIGGVIEEGELYKASTDEKLRLTDAGKAILSGKEVEPPPPPQLNVADLIEPDFTEKPDRGLTKQDEEDENAKRIALALRRPIKDHTEEAIAWLEKSTKEHLNS